jgi:hypothetical protein
MHCGHVEPTQTVRRLGATLAALPHLAFEPDSGRYENLVLILSRLNALALVSAHGEHLWVMRQR